MTLKLRMVRKRITDRIFDLIRKRIKPLLNHLIPGCLFEAVENPR